MKVRFVVEFLSIHHALDFFLKKVFEVLNNVNEKLTKIQQNAKIGEMLNKGLLFWEYSR